METPRVFYVVHLNHKIYQIARQVYDISTVRILCMLLFSEVRILYWRGYARLMWPTQSLMFC